MRYFTFRDHFFAIRVKTSIALGFTLSDPIFSASVFKQVIFIVFVNYIGGEVGVIPQLINISIRRYDHALYANGTEQRCKQPHTALVALEVFTLR